MLHTIRGKNQITLAVASTGIAAYLLNNWNIYHFGLPLKLNETSVSRYKANFKEAKKNRKAAGTHIDEASMCPALGGFPAYKWKMLEKVCKEVFRGNKDST